MRKNLTLLLWLLVFLVGFSSESTAQRKMPLRPDALIRYNSQGGTGVQHLLDMVNSRAAKHKRSLDFFPTQGVPSMPVHKAARLSETSSDLPLIWGNVVAGSIPIDPSTGDYAYGVYQITSSNGSLGIDSVHTGSFMRASGGGCFVGNIYHMIYLESFYGYTFMTYYRLNTDNWSLLNDGTDVEDYSLEAIDETYDPVSKQIYGYFLSSDGEKEEFGVIDYDNLSRTTISEDSIGAVTLSADKDGNLYAISTDGNLYKINKTDGSATKVGNTGFKPGGYRQSATFDLKNGKIYWAACLSDMTSHLICVDPSTGKGTDLGTFPGNQEIVDLYIPAPAEMDAPDHVDNVVIDFPNGSKTGTVSFTMPSKTYSGNVIFEQLSYSLIINGDTVRRGTAAPGDNVTEDITVEKDGMYNFNIVASNDKGSSFATSDKVYIGLGEPKDIDKVNLTIDGYHAHVTWNAPTESSTGGYINPDSMLYYVIRMPECIPVDTTSATSFEEDLPEGPYKSYFYAVTPQNGNHLGYSTMSNHVVCGHAFSVPYDQTYNDSTYLDIFKVIDANNDGHTWEFNDYGTTGIRYYINWSDTNTPADDWLVSPGISLEANKTYKVSFYTSVSDTAVYSISYGTGDDVSSYKELMPMTAKAYKITHPFDTLSFTAPVTASGEYHFAIHCTSPGTSLYFYLQRMTVEEGTSMNAPDSVTNVQVVPAAEGGLSSEIKFTAPQQSINGRALNNVNINIFRGSTLIKTMQGIAAGSEQMFTDDNPANGYNTYTIIASDSAGDGLPVSSRAWIGIDVPMPPRNVRAYIGSDKNETVHVSWDAPIGNIGVHGGWYDPNTVLYKITDNYGGSQADSVNTNEYAIPDAIVLNQKRQTQVYLNIQAFNAGGISSKTQSNMIWNGKPTQLPMQENFNGSYNGGYYTQNGWAEYTWTEPTRDNEFFILEGGSSDGDNYARYFAANYNSSDSLIRDGYLNSAKINIADAQKPALVFSYIAFPGFDNKLIVDAYDCNGDTVRLDSIDYAELTGKRGWRTRSIDLSGYKASGNPLLLLSFHAIDYTPSFTSTDSIAAVALDNIRVFDRKTNDLIASSLSGAESLMVGDSTTFYVKVENFGENNVESGSYTVKIVNDNDSILASVPGLSINSDEWKYVPVPFKAKINDRVDQKVHGVVAFESDENNDNNMTSDQNLHVSMPAYPSVNDLSASVKDSSEVTLSWSRPEDADAHTVNEGFEKYDNFTIENFGAWKLFDGDGAYGYNISGIDMPDMQTPSAYQIFNASACGLDPDYYGAYFPHNGDKCAISKAAIPDYAKNGHNDDWLISPKLSGNAQTISLWAKSTSQQMLETFQILYSTTGTDTADFKLLDTHDRISADWTEYTANLPEGTRYFAIRNISQDKYFFFVDDITFDAASMDILGYNIYDNGVLIGTTDGEASTFTINPDNGGTHRYQVSVVYDLGESALSNVAEAVTADGIMQIIANGKPFDIYTVDGKRIAHNVTTIKNLTQGIYIINGKKLVVK